MLDLFHNNGEPCEGRAWVLYGRTSRARRDQSALDLCANWSGTKHGHDLSAGDRVESQIEADDRRR